MKVNIILEKVKSFIIGKKFKKEKLLNLVMNIIKKRKKVKVELQVKINKNILYLNKQKNKTKSKKK